MKKILLALAACAISASTLAQPMREPPPPPGARMDRPHVMPTHRRQKVWVPAHRERGRMVRGHYVWR